MQQPTSLHCRDIRLVNNLTLVPPTPELQPAQIQMALKLILQDTYYSQTIATLTSGIFMVGLALQLHASNLLIGLLIAIPALTQLAQIPALYLVEKFESRKKITLFTTLLSRLMLLPIAITPLLPSRSLALTILVVSFIMHCTMGAMSACTWNSWVKDLVPAEELGSFFSKKLCLTSLMTIALTLLGGFFIDQWTHTFPKVQIWGYAVLLLGSFLIGLLGILPLRNIPEPVTHKTLDEAQAPSLITKLMEPFKDRNYRKLMTFLSSWNFAINLAVPFFTVYMLKLLGLPLMMVTLTTTLCQVVNLMLLRGWGHVSDRFGNKAILMISVPLYMACLLGWTYTTLPGKHAYTIFMVLVLHVLMGVATAGVTLANGNIAMKLAPAKKSTTYMATNNAIASLSAGIAPILGGLSVDFFTKQTLSLTLNWHTPDSNFSMETFDIQSWDFFFCFAAVLGMIALYHLKGVKEGQRVRKRVVVRELMQENYALAKGMFKRLPIPSNHD